MTKTELIESLCDYYDIDMPKENDKGEYDLSSYEWNSGSYFKNDRWLTLHDIVYALWYLCEDDE